MSPNSHPEPDASGGYRNAPVSSPSPDLQLPPAPTGPGAGDTLVVDLAALGKAVKAAQEAVGAAQKAAQPSQDAVSRSGAAPWGDDPGLGQAFGGVFAEPRNNLVEAVQKLPTVLQQMADNLTATQGVFADAEDASVHDATVLALNMGTGGARVPGDAA
jgi:hypothetical protein